jgi:hypothetical protein
VDLDIHGRGMQRLQSRGYIQSLEVTAIRLDGKKTIKLAVRQKQEVGTRNKSMGI